jgi:pimeloyl-ACP methyl ester carboxylesterase
VLTAGFARLDNRLRLAAQVWRALLDIGDRELTARFLTLVATGGSTLDALEPAALDAAVAGLAAFLPPGSPEQVDLVTSIDTRAELARIAVPTLVVATTEDGLTTVPLSRELAAGIPGAELVEVAAGHGIGAEARDEWLAAIRTFLARVG